MHKNKEKRLLLAELLAQAEKIKDKNVYKSASLGQPAYDLAEELNDKNSMAKAMYFIYIGFYYGKKENKSDYLNEALQMISPSEEAFVVRFHNLMGLECIRTGCYAQAIDQLNVGLSVAQQSEDNYQMSMILNNMGEVFRRLGDHNRAIAYYLEAYEIGRLTLGSEDEDLCSYALDNLVVSYSELERFDKAEVYLKVLEGLYSKTSNQYVQSKYLFSKAFYLKGYGYYQEAIDNYEQYLNHIDTLNLIRSKLDAYRYLGDCYKALDKKYEAIESYSKGCQLAADSDYGEDEIYYCDQLVSLYKKLDKLDEAVVYYERFSQKVFEVDNQSKKLRSDYIVQKIQFHQLKEAKAYVDEEHRKVLVGHENLKKSYKRLDLAVTIGNAIRFDPSCRDLLVLLHDQVSRMMPLSSIAIGRLDTQQQTIRMAYIIDESGVQDDIVLNLNRPEKFHMKECIQSRTSLLYRTNAEMISEPMKDYKLKNAYDAIQSGIYVPIISNGQVKGILTVQSCEPYAYSSEDLKVLEVISAYFSRINFNE